MSYFYSTRKKVENYLKKHKACNPNNLMHLGHKKVQIHQHQLNLILKDLENEKLIKVELIPGSNPSKRIKWTGDN